MAFSIREKVDEQEKRMIELVKENSQLKRDGLAMEAILAENNSLRKEIAERRASPISEKDWELKVSEIQSKYKGKAIAEGKLKKKVERLEADIKNFKTKLQELNTDSTTSEKIVPKLCVINADYHVFNDLNDAYNRIELLLKENEAYRNIVSELEAKIRYQETHHQDLQVYEDLLNESNHHLEEAQEIIESQRKTIQQLEGKIQSKEIMYDTYKDRNGVAIIVEGDEHDIYPGEQRDLIIEYLKSKIANLDPYTRQYHIVKSILEANPEVGNRAALKRGIYDAFRGFTGTSNMSQLFKTKMQELGFEIIKGGKTHDKLIFHNDDRYGITIPKTPKTRIHDNLNQAGDTVRIIL